MSICPRDTSVLDPIQLRRATGSDEDFLIRLEAVVSGLLDEPDAACAGAAASLERLIHRGREAAWRATWPQATCLVMECAGTGVGRMWVDTSSDAWHLLDLAVLPCHRGQGWGMAALRAWLSAADAAGIATQSRVALLDPFLLRLRSVGFVAVRQNRGQVWMERVPSTCAVTRWRQLDPILVHA